MSSRSIRGTTSASLMRSILFTWTRWIAFNSAEALERILLTTLQNIEAFETGRPINVVT
jgi:lactate dehydrogenase-like 2-hydroxyacid dehydrogenase